MSYFWKILTYLNFDIKFWKLCMYSPINYSVSDAQCNSVCPCVNGRNALCHRTLLFDEFQTDELENMYEVTNDFI